MKTRKMKTRKMITIFEWEAASAAPASKPGQLEEQH